MEVAVCGVQNKHKYTAVNHSISVLGGLHLLRASVCVYLYKALTCLDWHPENNLGQNPEGST
jgi:hypothetical protein